MLLSWDCIIKIFKKIAGHPVDYTGSNVPRLAPQFKWPDSPFKDPITVKTELFVLAEDTLQYLYSPVSI